MLEYLTKFLAWLAHVNCTACHARQVEHGVLLLASWAVVPTHGALSTTSFNGRRGLTKGGLHPWGGRAGGLHPWGGRAGGLHPWGGQAGGLHPWGGRAGGLHPWGGRAGGLHPWGGRAGGLHPWGGRAGGLHPWGGRAGGLHPWGGWAGGWHVLQCERWRYWWRRCGFLLHIDVMVCLFVALLLFFIACKDHIIITITVTIIWCWLYVVVSALCAPSKDRFLRWGPPADRLASRDGWRHDAGHRWDHRHCCWAGRLMERLALLLCPVLVSLVECLSGLLSISRWVIVLKPNIWRGGTGWHLLCGDSILLKLCHLRHKGV